MQRRSGPIAAVMLLTASALLTAQTSPTFKAEVEYVEVDAIVTDDQGRFVRGLQREDFQIFEDGKPQTVTTFALVDVPADRSQPPLVDGASVEADVQSSERPFTGRLYVLILDSLHTDASRTQRVRAAARRFIDQYLHANDLMAVVHTDGRTTGAQDFTASRRLLRAAVDGFMGQRLESATLARNTEFLRGSSGGGRVADPYDTERGLNARSTLRTVAQVADWLAGVRGRRKTILLISEGIDYDITDVFNNRSATSVMDETREAITAATRGNVSIYAIHPASVSGAADAIEVSGFADQVVSTSPTNDDGTVERAPGINSRGLDDERRLAQNSLRTLAEETGGVAAVGTDALSAFERVVADNSAYYVMAYYPTSLKRDGKFHRIEVRTSRPGLRVRARRGYVSPRDGRRAQRVPAAGDASPALVEALNSPLPNSGVGMRVFATPFKTTAPNASVVLAIELRGRDLAFAPAGRMEVSYAAVDASGRVRANDTNSFSLTLPPETRKRVEDHGMRLLNRVDLPPGRYQMRVAVRNGATGALGSLSYDLDVPDFQKLPFSMSGVLVTSTAGTATITARPDEQLRTLMPAPPVALRAFPSTDEVLVVAEIYDRPDAAPHTVDIVTTVRSGDGKVHVRSSEQRSSTELKAGMWSYRYAARVPIGELEPGRYVLTVDARSRLGHTATRHVPFEVVP